MGGRPERPAFEPSVRHRKRPPETIIAGNGDDIDSVTTPISLSSATLALCARSSRASLGLKESTCTIYAHTATWISHSQSAPHRPPVLLRHAQDHGTTITSQASPNSPEIDSLIGRRRNTCERMVQLKHAGLSSQLAPGMLRRRLRFPLVPTCELLDDMTLHTG